MATFMTTSRANTGFSRVFVQSNPGNSQPLAQTNPASARFFVQPGKSDGSDDIPIQRQKFAFIDGLYGPVTTPPYAGAFHLYGWDSYELNGQPNMFGIPIDAGRLRPALMSLCLSQKPIGSVRVSMPSTKDHRDIGIFNGAVITAVSPIDYTYYPGEGNDLFEQITVTFACRSYYWRTVSA